MIPRNNQGSQKGVRVVSASGRDSQRLFSWLRLANCITGLLALILAANSAQAATIDLVPANALDALYIWHTGTLDSTSQNMGVLTVSYPPYYRHNRGIMEIDVSGIPSGSTINSATLRLTGNRSGAAAGNNLAIYGYVGDGIVDGSEWSPLQTYLVGTPAWVSTSPASTTVPIDTTFIGSALSSTGYAGFQLYDPSGTNNAGVQVYTSEHPTVGWWPTLTIDYIPEPSAFVLAAIALLSLLAHGRRRRV